MEEKLKPQKKEENSVERLLVKRENHHLQKIFFNQRKMFG